jgi:hypothetical protein
MPVTKSATEPAGRHKPDRVVDTLAHELRLAFGPDPGRMPLQAIVFSTAKPPLKAS